MCGRSFCKCMCAIFFNGQRKRRRIRKQKAYMCTKFAIIAIRWCTPNACKYSLTHSNDLYYFCLVSSRFLSASFEFLFPHFYAQTSCLWQQLMTEDQTYFFRFFFLANAHGLWFFKKKSSEFIIWAFHCILSPVHFCVALLVFSHCFD